MGLDVVTLCAVGQMGAVWTGGGTLIAWSSLIAVAGFARVPVLALVRSLLLPVLAGLAGIHDLRSGVLELAKGEVPMARYRNLNGTPPPASDRIEKFRNYIDGEWVGEPSRRIFRRRQPRRH